MDARTSKKTKKSKNKPKEVCGATAEPNYGVCQLPKDPPHRYHQEWRDGKLWAEWSGDDREK